MSQDDSIIILGVISARSEPITVIGSKKKKKNTVVTTIAKIETSLVSTHLTISSLSNATFFC